MNVEQVLIGAVITTGDISVAIEAGVTPVWFTTYPDEWRFIANYYRKHQKTPPALTMRIKFPSFKIIKTDDLDHAVEEMRLHHVKQSMLAMVDEVLAGLEDNREVSEVLSTTQTTLVSLQSRIEGTRNESNIGNDWRRHWLSTVARSKKHREGKLAGLPSGWPSLDMNTGGFQPGEYWVVAARLGQGKTWALIRWTMESLAHGGFVQYDALEQTRHQITNRFHAFMSRKWGNVTFTASDLRLGNVDTFAYREFLATLPTKMPGTLIVNDTSRGRVNAMTLAAQIERNQPSVLIVDYLTLVSNTPGDWTAVAQLSGEIKGLAMKYGIPIIVANQLNRTAAGMSREMPGTEALSATDAIGQDADGVITMRKKSPHCMQVHVAKYRHGDDGYGFYCDFHPNEGVFEEISGDQAQEIIDRDADEKASRE